MNGRIETVINGEVHAANPDTFRRLDGPMVGHSSDGVGVWQSGGQGFHPIREADATTWQCHGNGWSKDARHVYKNGEIVEDAAHRRESQWAGRREPTARGVA